VAGERPAAGEFTPGSDGRAPAELEAVADREPTSAITVDRREAVKAMALLPLVLPWNVTPPQLERTLTALATAGQVQGTYEPQFFTASEWATVRMLADYIIPRDERSGSATEAKVPEYIDFLLADRDASETSKTAMRGGLGWLDFEAQRRFASTFVAATDAQRRSILDDIAWPARARPEMSHGVAFFNRFRDLVGAGFFSSAMGWRDLEYVGNAFMPAWNGCSPEAMAKLGVSQDLMRTRIPIQR
jgi:gluconate 2-dehydrogenase gamma chain